MKLAAVAIPVFPNQQTSALIATVKNDVHNVTTAVTTWQTTHTGKISQACVEGAQGCLEPGSTLYALFLFLGAVTTIIVAIGFAAGIADRNAENARLREEARRQQFLHPRRINR